MKSNEQKFYKLFLSDHLPVQSLSLGGIYTINVFYCEIILFFTKKFRNLGKQLKILNATKGKLIDNRRLSRLLYDYNRVLHEMDELNEFFKHYTG